MKKYFIAYLELFHILNNFNMVVLSSYIYQILSFFFFAPGNKAI